MVIKSIGRGQGNDIVINDNNVSRTHCQIIRKDNGEFVLVDINSTNGTYINGILQHGEVRLNRTDIVRIGNTTLPWQSYFPSVPEDPDIKPDNFLVWSILCTIFCCVPFGIVSIVYASKVDNLWARRDYAGAELAARRAKTWFWWAFGTGLFVELFSLIYCLIAGFAFGSAL